MNQYTFRFTLPVDVMITVSGESEEVVLDEVYQRLSEFADTVWAMGESLVASADATDDLEPYEVQEDTV